MFRICHLCACWVLVVLVISWSFDAQGPYGFAYSFFLTVVILVNVATFVLSTEQGMDKYRGVPDAQHPASYRV